jgi:FAD/FMN-containing dehydrogenase
MPGAESRGTAVLREEGFSGELLSSTDAEYDAVRRVQNGMIDRRPALIARCRTTDDVIAALGHARAQGLEVCVRGGGHNVAGRAVADGALMIDLSPMKKIEVNAERREANVEAGVTWAEMNAATQVFRLATTGGVVGTTGVAGLTLGGGFGWLLGKYGLSVDNLLSVDIVTADGELRRASATENADLFWAVRGGGGNFGVATSFRFALHPVGPYVTGGLAAWPLEQGPELFRFYREFSANATDDLTSFFALVHAPDGSGAKLAAILLCHIGNEAVCAETLRQVRAFGTPAVDGLGPITYTDLNAMLDAGFPKGALNYWKSSFVSGLQDDMIDGVVEDFAACPAPLAGIVVEHYHGACARVPVHETAFPHRRTGYNILYASQWLDPDDTERGIAWARNGYQRLSRFAAEGSYVNYLDTDDSAELGRAYGPNLPRLREIKRRYDPDNVFRHNVNISPAELPQG